MPKSRTSRRSSSSSSSRRSSSSSRKSKKMTTSRKQPKGVPMPPHHIKRIMDLEKELYLKLAIPFNHEDRIKEVLPQLRFKRPSDPYLFWGNIHGWHDAVRKALPIKN